MVTLVACNTRQIAAGHYLGAPAVGFLISLMWWSNSDKGRPQGKWAGVAYALGAAVGTATGMFIGGLWKAG